MGFLSEMLGGKDEHIPAVDKKIVEKALNEALWPVLKAHGFQTFKGCTAWRHQDKKIDVVEIQLFPKAQVDKWGITPYSFALPVGCFFPFVPSLYEPRIKRENGLLLPDEPQSHLRKTTFKSFKQRECKIPNIWYIDPKGKYLNAAIEDAKNLLGGEVDAWFERFNDFSVLLKYLTEIPRADIALGMTLGFPRHLTGFLALEIGEWSLAKNLLQNELNSDLLNPGSARVANLFNDKVVARITKDEAAFNDKVAAGIAKAEAALRGSDS